MRVVYGSSRLLMLGLEKSWTDEIPIIADEAKLSVKVGEPNFNF